MLEKTDLSIYSFKPGVYRYFGGDFSLSYKVLISWNNETELQAIFLVVPLVFSSIHVVWEIF